jgi:hypothetical protein
MSKLPTYIYGVTHLHTYTYIHTYVQQVVASKPASLLKMFRTRDKEWEKPQELHAVLFEKINLIEDYLSGV